MFRGIGHLKPRESPPQCSEEEVARKVDPKRHPDGSALPKSGEELRAKWPVPEPRVRAAAKDYMLWVTQQGAKERGKELLKGALDRGDALLEAAGQWMPAVVALRFAWEVDLGRGHTDGIFEAKWEDRVSHDLLQYLRVQVAEGAQVRQDTPGGERVRAKAHATSTKDPGAIIDKLWRKGAVLGRKLLCRANRKELERVSDDLPGLEECSNGAVPKQNADPVSYTHLTLPTILLV